MKKGKNKIVLKKQAYTTLLTQLTCCERIFGIDSEVPKITPYIQKRILPSNNNSVEV